MTTMEQTVHGDTPAELYALGDVKPLDANQAADIEKQLEAAQDTTTEIIEDAEATVVDALDGAEEVVSETADATVAALEGAESLVHKAADTAESFVEKLVNRAEHAVESLTNGSGIEQSEPQNEGSPATELPPAA